MSDNSTQTPYRTASPPAANDRGVSWIARVDDFMSWLCSDEGLAFLKGAAVLAVIVAAVYGIHSIFNEIEAENAAKQSATTAKVSHMTRPEMLPMESP